MMDYGTRKRSERRTEADAQNAEIRQRKALCGTNQRTTVCPQQGGPQTGVQAVSEIGGKGKARTVPTEEKNKNSFLKFEKNSSILENFIRNFWSQLKEPTHFRLIQMTVHDYKQNRQAIRDLS